MESSVQRCLEVLVLNNLWSQSMSRNTVATTIYLCLSFKSSLEIHETVNLRQGSEYIPLVSYYTMEDGFTFKTNKTNQPTELKKLLKPVSVHAVID